MSSDARPSVLVHATEELLEEYSFGRICGPQLGWLEEHLLICPQCQSALGEVDEYIVFMKAGLAFLEKEGKTAGANQNLAERPDPAAPAQSWLRKALSFDFGLPRMPLMGNLLAATLLLTLAGVTVAWRIQAPAAMAAVATVKLIGLRGGEGAVARAPAGHPLDLVFDRTDLTSDLAYRGEVVDSSGRQMWEGSVRIIDQSLSIRVDRPLAAGAYWVRLYSSSGQLRREFALNAG